MTLKGYQWARLVLKHPELSESCQWERLTSEDWGTLLAEEPSYANRCVPSEIVEWDRFKIISKQPQLISLFTNTPVSIKARIINFLTLR